VFPSADGWGGMSRAPLATGRNRSPRPTCVYNVPSRVARRERRVLLRPQDRAAGSWPSSAIRPRTREPSSSLIGRISSKDLPAGSSTSQST
jgi:hypothetical protein